MFFLRLRALCFYIKMWYFALKCYLSWVEFFWCPRQVPHSPHPLLTLLHPKRGRKGGEKEACSYPLCRDTNRYGFSAWKTSIHIQKTFKRFLLLAYQNFISGDVAKEIKRSRWSVFLNKDVHLCVIYNTVMLEITWLPNNRFILKNSVYSCNKMLRQLFWIMFFKIIFPKNI